MNTEELLTSIINPNAHGGQYAVEVRKDDGYWFVTAVDDEEGRTYNTYDLDLNYALTVLFNWMKEDEAWS